MSHKHPRGSRQPAGTIPPTHIERPLPADEGKAVRVETHEPDHFTDGPIEGVVVVPLATYSDDRGWLTELFRADEMQADCMPLMAYVSETLPGVVRGPHHHVAQTDCFGFVGPGEFEVFLWDVRVGSPTWGRRMKLCAGASKKRQLTIPPGVVHAYRNVGDVPGWTFNAANQLYAGEGRCQPVDEVRHEERPSHPYRMD